MTLPESERRAIERGIMNDSTREFFAQVVLFEVLSGAYLLAKRRQNHMIAEGIEYV